MTITHYSQQTLEADIAQVYALLSQQRVLEAEHALLVLLNTAPQHAELHRAMAVIAQLTARGELAVEAMQRAVELAPTSAALHQEFGQVLASAGRIDDAVAAFQHAVDVQPDFVQAWYLLGMTLYGARRDAEALPALTQAHALAPDHPQILRALAETEYALEHHAAALMRYESIVASGQLVDAGLFLRLSQCKRRTGAVEHALHLVREGLQRFPEEATLWLELGWVQEDLGDADQAQDAYLRAHALRPEWGDPLAFAIGLARDAAPDALVREAEIMLANTSITLHERAYLHHVLGKRDDARGAYAEAADHWSAANAVRRTCDLPFDREFFSAQVDTAIDAFTPELLHAFRDASLPDERPVFVVGMPRSGTTLVEQILAAHPQGHGCGELTAIATIVHDASEYALGNAELCWPQDAGRINTDWLRVRAVEYLNTAAAFASTEARRLIDKQPYNFLHIGLIAMLFADARIVWCQRDSRDIALSIFSESFSPLSGYATDLDDIAFVIAQQERLMRHWQAVSPLKILEIQYETLVTDIDTQCRRLIDFVGLPWDERCLAFHDNRRSVQTLSRWQVRQPAHTRSIGRWRKYPQWFSAV